MRRLLSVSAAGLLICLCNAGCGIFVPAYDEWTDQRATGLNEKVQRFYIDLAGSDDAGQTFGANKTKYEDILGDFMAILTRAQARQDVDMTEALMISIISWKATISVHKGDEAGGNKEGLKIARELLGLIKEQKVETAFVKSNEINTAAKGSQPGHKLSPFMRDTIAETLQQQLRIIVSIEVAKKEFKRPAKTSTATKPKP